MGWAGVTERQKPKADEESDERLVELARLGDRYALGRLLARYRDRAVRAAYGMLGCREDAEDVAQEAFIRVFRALGSYEGKGKFFTWLYRIILNLCASKRRKSSSREIVTDEAEVPGQRVMAEAEARNIEVWETIGRLPAQQRAALILREMDLLSYAEIAQVMGIAEGTVKYHLSEARRKFRRIWQKEANHEV